MRNRLKLLAAACALAWAAPGDANLVEEPTFQEKMDLSELVVIATVTAVHRGGRWGVGGTATLTVLTTLKGESRNSITVTTYHPISEMSPQCCTLAATYLMFLQRSGNADEFASIRGVYGMVRVGAPPSQIRVIPAEAAPRPH
jgi:hypothetical protein